jgi:hypothetical protein
MFGVINIHRRRALFVEMTCTPVRHLLLAPVLYIEMVAPTISIYTEFNLLSPPAYFQHYSWNLDRTLWSSLSYQVDRDSMSPNHSSLADCQWLAKCDYRIGPQLTYASEHSHSLLYVGSRKFLLLELQPRGHSYSVWPTRREALSSVARLSSKAPRQQSSRNRVSIYMGITSHRKEIQFNAIYSTAQSHFPHLRAHCRESLPCTRSNSQPLLREGRQSSW